MKFSLAPGPIVVLLLGAFLYVRAVGTLRGRGYHVPRWQQAAWWTGLTLEAVALLGPLDAYADQALSAHMAQHLLLGDIAAPFLLAGLRTPVLLFLLPRPALKTLARRHGLRRVFGVLRRPLVAFPLYVVALYGWHIGFAFEGALRNPVVHVLQHQTFLAVNLLLWWPVLEPQRRRMPGHLWKIGYIFAARMSSMFLGMGFVFSHGALYGDFYGSKPVRHGLSVLGDQQTAGGMMMSLDIIIIFLALCYFFFYAARQSAATERAETAERTGAPAVT
ncbi:MAG: cytochrome c oxidase assembly protein [Solirubrobacteraceae bacterium]